MARKNERVYSSKAMLAILAEDSNNHNWNTEFDNVISVSFDTVDEYVRIGFETEHRSVKVIRIDCANMRSRICANYFTGDFGLSRGRSALARKVKGDCYLITDIPADIIKTDDKGNETRIDAVAQIKTRLSMLKDKDGNYIFRFKTPARLEHYRTLVDDEFKARSSKAQNDMRSVMTATISDDEFIKACEILAKDENK